MVTHRNESASIHWIGNLAGRFYSDRRLVILTVLLAIASGASSLLVMPRMEDPLLTQRACTIVTTYPGADAQRVEALVTEKIEEQLLDIPEIKRLRSQSRANNSFISVELRDDVYDTDPVWSALRGKLEDSISLLPSGASRPVFNELDIAAYAWIGAIVWNRPEEKQSSGILRRLARELKDSFFSISGTKSVDLFGDPLEEILVEVDPARAGAAGISPNEIARQLRKRDVKESAGLLRGDNSESVIELNNQFSDMQDILDATLHTSRPGETLRLSDLATVVRGTPQPAAARAIIDGRPGVVVSVMLRPRYRIDHWASRAEDTVQQFRSRLPKGVDLDIIMQQSDYVAQRMNSLARNLLLGVSAVAMVTLIFMGWRSSLLVTSTLPIASLMVVGGMSFLGIPIHQMSITGLIIALGLLIDNAIIATDEIDLSLRRGNTPLFAVRDMVTRLFAPLLASTVTTAFAFAPIALMEGPAGEFVGSIAITVMLAIFSSFALAMTILPATAALLQVGFSRQNGARSAVEASGSETKSFAGQMLRHGISIPPITRLYRRFLRGMLTSPWIGVALGTALPIAGFVAATQLDEQFFPPADRDQFYVEVELAPQATMSQTQQITTAVDRLLSEEKRVQHTAWFLGESAPPFYYNIIARRKNNPNYAQAIVTLDSNENSLEMIRRLQLELDDRFPQARILVRQLEQGPPFDAPVEIRVFGSDLDRLKNYGERIRTLASRVPDILHVRTALNDIRPVASISVRGAEASWAGLSEADIAAELFSQVEGVVAGSIIEEVEEIPVRVRIAGEHRRSVGDIADSGLLVNMRSRTTSLSNGASGRNDLITPVSAVARVDVNPQLAVITRYNGRRMNEVQAFITAGTLPSSILSLLQDEISESDLEDLPPGYSLEVGGESSERDAAVGRLMESVSVLVVGVVGALVLALASFRLAALIGVVAALSIGLGMGALWVFGYPFGFMAIVGTMGLVGIAINDSIVVVAALGANKSVRAGDLDATIETVVDVTRHVMATTATTVVGFLPLVLSGGGFWPPLAVAIGTGVTGATLISLTLVPSAFRIMSRRAIQPS